MINKFFIALSACLASLNVQAATITTNYIFDTSQTGINEYYAAGKNIPINIYDNNYGILNSISILLSAKVNGSAFILNDCYHLNLSCDPNSSNSGFFQNTYQLQVDINLYNAQGDIFESSGIAISESSQKAFYSMNSQTPGASALLDFDPIYKSVTLNRPSTGWLGESQISNTLQITEFLIYGGNPACTGLLYPCYMAGGLSDQNLTLIYNYSPIPSTFVYEPKEFSLLLLGLGIMTMTGMFRKVNKP
jgi:hypothetical protein